MEFKLDENFGRTIQKLLEQAGHDARTVHEEDLQGATDPEIFEAAKGEGRILLTMDHDFGNVLLFRHTECAGVAIVNPPGRPSAALLRMLVLTLLKALRESDITGHLWIVEPGRIREHARDLPD